MAEWGVYHRDRQQLRETPHITGLVARILAKHPTVTVFQLKTILYALASNATSDPDMS